MDNPAFYIITPVYKVEKYIRECFDSVLKQSNPNFHLIAVDDGSPDRSGEICEEYARRDSRFTVLHQKNQGQLAARQAAIRKALETAQPTDYILFLDSDDALEPDALEIARRTIAQEQCDMVVWGYQIVTNGAVTFRSEENRPCYGTVTDYAALLRHLFCDGYSSIWRRVTAARLFDGETSEALYHVRIGEDQLQFLPILPKCRRVTFVHEMPYLYRCNPNSITMQPTPAAYAAGATFMKECWRFLEEQNVWTDADWESYLASCRWQLDTDISSIARMEIPQKEKSELLRQYLADPLFQKVMNSGRPKQLFLLLGRNRMYRIAAVLGTTMHSLGNLKRRLLHQQRV